MGEGVCVYCTSLAKGQGGKKKSVQQVKGVKSWLVGED